MKRSLRSSYINLLTIAICLGFNASAKEIILDYSDSLKQKAVIIHVGNSSNKFAVLMRDTTLWGNKFDYSWHKGVAENGKLSQTTYQLPAFLVDSALAAFCDSLFISDPKSNKIRLSSWPKKKISSLTKKNVRLYIGYIDDKGNRNVVVQFISLKEFRKNYDLYSNQLFLVVPRKELHFAIINIGR